MAAFISKVRGKSILLGALPPALSLLFCIGCAVPQPRGAGKLGRVIEPTSQRGYWLYLPKDYVAATNAELKARRWPLVVTFHGMQPFDNARPQACEWQQEADRYGFIVVAPELRTFHVFGQFPLRTISAALVSDEEATLTILNHIFQTTRADPSNVLSTSWSSGGYIAHYMLNRHPDRFTCLAVRQSNFSSSVLDPDLTKRSMYHPILILNTQNDFSVCRRESKDAVTWYETHGYKNVYWAIIKDKGHERTPDMAAEFYARIAGVEASFPPAVLASRQAIDGNAEGIAFLAGRMSALESPPQSSVFVRAPSRSTNSGSGDASGAPSRLFSGESATVSASKEGTGGSVARQAPVIPQPPVRRNPLKIRLSSAIGIEPLWLVFSAECPASWQDTAQFLWTMDGQQIGTGINGQKTLAAAGEHVLSLRVTTASGEEFQASRTIRVLPRLDGFNSSTQ